MGLLAEASSNSDALFSSLSRLARGDATDLSALLHDIEVHATIDNTRAVFHCHSLQLDGNGRPRIKDLVAAICDHVLDFAIPRSSIGRARDELQSKGSTAHMMRLRSQAIDLFTDLSNTGEGGELLLFVLAEKILRLPQIICKMDLKTNSRMHIHGADGLHAGSSETDGRLVLYWGESKILANASDGIREALKSLAPMLINNENGGARTNRDLTLLSRYADLDDQNLEQALKKYLNPQDPLFNSLEFRGLCLVGFDCDVYPPATEPAEMKALVAAITALLPAWKIQIEKRVDAEKLKSFAFHFICVPFPSAEDFRLRLRKELGLTNGSK